MNNMTNEEANKNHGGWPREEHRRFEELWEGKDDPEQRIIRLRDGGEASPARRRNRLFYVSFIISAVMLIVAVWILAKTYFKV